MANLDFAKTEEQALGLWNRPGGKIKGILLIVGFLFLAWKVFPVFTQALDNTADFAWGISVATFAIFCAILSVLIVYTLLTSKKVKAIALALWDILMDYTVGLVVSYKPEVLARAEVEQNFVEVKKMEAQVDGIAEKEEDTKAKLDANQKEIQKILRDESNYQSLTPADLANRGLEPQDVAGKLSVMENKRNRLLESCAKLSPVYDMLRNLRINFNQLAKNMQIEAEKRRDDVEIAIDTYQAYKAGNNAAQQFMRILSGENDKSYMGQKALMEMQQQIANDRSQIKQVLRKSKDFIQSVNLDQAVYDKAALDYLNDYKKKFELELKANPNQKAIPSTFTSQETLDAKSSYNDLIN